MIPRKRALWALAVVTCAWVGLQFAFLRPQSIAHYWRQAETQSMALNMAHREFSLFYPQINWGGDGPGYVEAELPLYQALVAPLLALTQDAEWPGQLLSIMCMGLSAIVLFRMLERRFGPVPALLGAFFVLSTPLTVHLSVAVMPDSLCGLLYLVSLERFLMFVETSESSPIILSSLALAAASVIKPTALHLGAAEFLTLLFARRDLLRKPVLWIGWGTTLLLVGGYLAHGVHIHHVYGNSFGVISGGDSKFPRLSDVFSKNNVYNLTQMSLKWGVGYVPLALGVFALLRRKWTSIEFALAFANILVLFASMRYAMFEASGAHYHLFAMFFGVMLLAQAIADIAALLNRYRYLQGALFACAVFAVGAQYLGSTQVHLTAARETEPAPIVEISKHLTPLVGKGDLVVIQSEEDAWDAGWQRADNYQDPRGFYAGNARGWSLAHDRAVPENLATYAAKGARFYVVPGETPPALKPWLEAHATLAYHNPAGSIFALHGATHESGQESASGATGATFAR